jgi:hypothetical protein
MRFVQSDSVRIKWFVSVLTTQTLWLAQKSSQMCSNEVRITERGFIFVGACNAPHNRMGERCEHNFKTSSLFAFIFQFIFLFSSLLYKSTLLI